MTALGSCGLSGHLSPRPAGNEYYPSPVGPRTPVRLETAACGPQPPSKQQGGREGRVDPQGKLRQPSECSVLSRPSSSLFTTQRPSSSLKLLFHVFPSV